MYAAEELADALTERLAPALAAAELTAAHFNVLYMLIEDGPIPAVDGVVRWRACDLVARVHEAFAISVSEMTIYRALKGLGYAHVSARPKAYKQDQEVLAAFKKTFPSAWRRSATACRLARP
jgi:transposase